MCSWKCHCTLSSLNCLCKHDDVIKRPLHWQPYPTAKSTICGLHYTAHMLHGGHVRCVCSLTYSCTLKRDSSMTSFFRLVSFLCNRMNRPKYAIYQRKQIIQSQLTVPQLEMRPPHSVRSWRTFPGRPHCIRVPTARPPRVAPAARRNLICFLQSTIRWTIELPRRVVQCKVSECSHSRNSLRLD